MEQARWHRLRDLFAQAQELAPEARKAFIEQASRDDPELGSELESLLNRAPDGPDPIGAVVADAVREGVGSGIGGGLRSGQRVGHYLLIGKLGQGGMGEVYAAEDLELKRRVALKVLAPWIGSGPDVLRRFKREAQALAALNHPNIVTIYSVEQEGGRHFLTMELVEGRPLSDAVSPSGLAVDELLRIAVSLTEALAAAHDQGVIHRDLKPANVMLSESGAVKILDFGLAKLRPVDASAVTEGVAAAGGTKAGQLVGTLAYMSPEQVDGQALDHRSDLFSLGVLLYELATGVRPFTGDTPSGIMGSILHHRPRPVTELRKQLPIELAEIIERCLEKDPRRRVQNARDLHAQLERVQPEEARSVGSRPGDLRVKKPGRVAAALGLLVAVTVALTFGVEWMRKSSSEVTPAAPPTIDSLAVLPLVSLSEDPEQEYFADGMTDAMIAELSKIAALKVISRTSVMRYKDTQKSLPQIAGELDVTGVVEGSVLRADNQVRITAQLIHASSDRHLWAGSYERDLGDVLGLQSEVAWAIASEIHAQLTPAEEQRLRGARAVDPAAYDAYLRGLSEFHKLSPDHVERAREYFELALEKDPDFALPYVGLANIWGARTTWGPESPAVAGPKITQWGRRAAALDDSSAEAHSVLAKVAFYQDRDWSLTASEFQRAIELDPNDPYVRFDYALFLSCMGRPEAAMEQAERALELDPFNSPWRTGVGFVEMYAGRFEEASEQFGRALASDPNVLPARHGLWLTLRQLRRNDEALAAATRVFSMMGDREVVAVLEQADPASGYEDAMRRAAELVQARAAQTYVASIVVARLWAHAGEEEQALRWLERAYVEGSVWLVHLAVDPDWRVLRDDSRFEDLLERVGTTQ